MNKKIRVAFFPPSDTSWMGGVNYYKNLFYALHKHVSSEIEVIVFLSANADSFVIKNYLPFVDHVFYIKFLDKTKFTGFISKLESRVFGTSYFMGYLLNKYRIDIISHSHFSGFKTIKSIGWIPDFQHLHLPDMFTKKEIVNRDKGFMRLIKKSDAVFLSSYDSFNDYKQFSPRFINKAKVLQFVSQPEDCYFKLTDDDRCELLNKYNLPECFFFLPNQFWKHKNHITAFKAVRLLKDRDKEVYLVCTGNLKDYRDSNYVQYLKNFISENNLDKNIILLELVPYKDVYSLIKFSRAVLNPSLFEGWSSTVEECKSVGKSLIISDINVHKEQAPDAIFFEKNSPESLSEVLAQFSDAGKTGINLVDLNFRTKKYAENYLDVIKSLVTC
ncbi:MAG: glycosyltransferase [Methyloprofundus sp.]|nr:glycosyltransferase [Methyloprofundus sp.]